MHYFPPRFDKTYNTEYSYLYSHVCTAMTLYIHSVLNLNYNWYNIAKYQARRFSTVAC